MKCKGVWSPRVNSTWYMCDHAMKSTRRTTKVRTRHGRTHVPMTLVVLLPWLTKPRFKTCIFNGMWPPHVYATLNTDVFHTKYLGDLLVGHVNNMYSIRDSRIFYTTKVAMVVGTHNYGCFHRNIWLLGWANFPSRGALPLILCIHVRSGPIWQRRS